MMDEKIAAYEIERVIGEWQGKSIAGNSAFEAIQMGAGAIQQRDAQVY